MEVPDLDINQYLSPNGNLDNVRDDIELFDEFYEQITRGMAGDAVYLPYPFRSLGEHLLLEPSRYHLVAGDAGSGKSAYVDHVYVLGPATAAIHDPSVKFHALVWKLERRKQTVGKWARWYLWHKFGVMVSDRIVYSKGGEELPKEIYTLIGMVRPWMEQVFERVELYGGINPTGVYKRLRDYYDERGHYTPGKREKKIYVPNDPDLITVAVGDHMGLFLDENGLSYEKQKIDKVSEHFRSARDENGLLSVAVQQVNRGLMDPTRRTKMKIKMEKADLEGSSGPFKDCDACIGMIDAARYDITEYENYDVNLFTTKDGSCRMRFAQIMKNNWGSDNVFSALGFYGEIGDFFELPGPQKVKEGPYMDAFWNFQGALVRTPQGTLGLSPPPVWDYRDPHRLDDVRRLLDGMRGDGHVTPTDHRLATLDGKDGGVVWGPNSTPFTDEPDPETFDL